MSYCFPCGKAEDHTRAHPRLIERGLAKVVNDGVLQRTASWDAAEAQRLDPRVRRSASARATAPAPARLPARTNQAQIVSGDGADDAANGSSAGGRIVMLVLAITTVAVLVVIALASSDTSDEAPYEADDPVTSQSEPTVDYSTYDSGPGLDDLTVDSDEDSDTYDDDTEALDGVDPELAARGVDASLLQQFGGVVDLYGYGLGEGTVLPDEDVATFALIMIDKCDEVAAGLTTWSDEIDTDIMDGAPPEDASGFNSFMESVFCAQIT